MFAALKHAARLIAAASLLLSMPGAHAQSPHVSERLRGAFPRIDLQQREAAGERAVSLLGSRLPEVAAWYGKSASQLRSELLSDKRMRLDRHGRLLAVDELQAPLPTGGIEPRTQQSVRDGQLLPLEQTFQLHSNPGAERTIYLDFDGATLTNTAWNNGSPITAPPFDTDGNRAAFSSAELARIQYIWQRVAEDYAPFGVDVTTEAPAPDRLSRDSSTDTVFGTTVLVTTSAGVYSCSCGGVAYIGVFNALTDAYKPALVFYDMLGGGNEKYVAEAISHEAGHNMGLSHDGTSTAGYYAGQGNDAVTGWAPIMGVGYYKPLVQFSKGEYSGANNRQDDFAVAQSYGLPLRADDYGNTAATASYFQGTDTSGVTSGAMGGTIHWSGDRDVFALRANAGRITASAAPSSRSPNADLVLTLTNASGAVLAASNPLNALNASISYQLPSQGTYFLEVKGTGQGDPASTGYSAYGSVGYYTLSASFPTALNTPPTPVLTATPVSGTAPLVVNLDASKSTDNSKVQAYYWDFGDGTSDRTGSVKTTRHTYQAGSYTVRLTVADDTGLQASATQAISVTAPALLLASVKSTAVTLNSTRTSATALVSVVGPDGKALSGATVAASWSGLVTAKVSAVTDSLGQVRFTSPASSSSGCFTLTVTNVTRTGYAYQSSAASSGQACK